MLISKKWLSKFVPNLDGVKAEVIASELSQSLAEVEDYWNVGAELEKLVVAKVLSVEPHPDAEKLHICKVDIGSEKVQIVCGAPNVAAGQTVVACLPGGSVLGEKSKEKIKIGVAKLRGIDSSGMLCSERELGISDNHDGILVLADTYHPGDEFDDLLKDTIFEIENKSLTHRGDCFSHIGIAREIAARLDLPFIAPEYLSTLSQTESLPLEISVETELCPRFLAVTIANVSAAVSPFWLKLALNRVGVRSINHLVDITNYLMLETGQPLHMYDYAKIVQNKLIVREARAGEIFTALDHKEYVLAEGDLVIADSKKILGLAGIMGGLDSEVSEATTSGILEAAVFDKVQILKTARRLGLKTEASTRFSKGVDQANSENVLKHAVELLAEEQHLDIASEILDLYSKKSELVELTVDLNDIAKTIGEEIEVHKILHLLELLGIEIKNRNSLQTISPVTTAKPITIIIPTWRQDLRLTEDIAEEIARLNGYEKIKPRLPLRESKGQNLPVITQVSRKTSQKLRQLGYSEVINYSFISKQNVIDFQLNAKELLEITNAISPELNYFRNSLIPGLSMTILKNMAEQCDLKIFEIGRIIDTTNITKENLPYQPRVLGMTKSVVLAGNNNAKNAFLQFKGDLETLLLNLNIPESEITWSDGDNQKTNLPTGKALTPNKTSLLTIKGELIGVISEITRPIVYQLTNRNDLRIFVSEINIDKLISLEVIGQNKYQNFSIYPTINRDISCYIAKADSIGTILTALRQNKLTIDIPVNINYSLVDEFTQEGIRSITLRVELEPLTKTLTDVEANQIILEISTVLTEKFKVKLR